MPKVPGVPGVPRVIGVFSQLFPWRRSRAQAPQDPPKGLMPNLGRPTKPEDVVPLLDFDKYFLGKWTFQADAPDSVLGPGGEVVRDDHLQETG